MPVGTAGSVKGLTPAEIRAAGTQILLANTYHLMLRPGADVIRALGGLHRFMAWDGPILTDSGGFQVFSLGELRKITEDGVRFQSHLDGSYHLITPESSIAIQEALGGDIIMCFDECPPAPADFAYVSRSLALTSRWARRCKEARTRSDQALFGIVQGGMFKDLREKSAAELQLTNVDRIAVGRLVDRLQLGPSGEPCGVTNGRIGFHASLKLKSATGEGRDAGKDGSGGRGPGECREGTIGISRGKRIDLQGNAEKISGRQVGAASPEPYVIGDLNLIPPHVVVGERGVIEVRIPGGSGRCGGERSSIRNEEPAGAEGRQPDIADPRQGIRGAENQACIGSAIDRRCRHQATRDAAEHQVDLLSGEVRIPIDDA